MRRWRYVLLAVVAVVALAGGWVAWQSWQVSRSLAAAADDAASLKEALAAGDDAAVQRELTEFQEHTREGRDLTDGITWSALTHAPGVGDDAQAVRLVSRTLADLSESGIGPLAESASDLEFLTPSNGRIQLDALKRLREPVANANLAFAAARERLARQDASSLTGPLRDRYQELTVQVSDASSALSNANIALEVMPGLLGDEAPRNYLLIFQNNAEIRATGGLPGAVALLHAENGELSLTQQVAGSTFGETDNPILPLTDAERAIYGEQLGTYFLDANFTPDFGRAADLWRARWQSQYGLKVDGVLALDPVTLSFLMPAFPPLQVDGITLTADNVVYELLHGVYLRYADPAEQDEFFKKAARHVFESLVGTGVDQRLLLQGLARGANQHRLLVHSFHAQEQSHLAGTAVSGQWLNLTGSKVGVGLNDTTGAKMSYFLRSSVGLGPASCEGDQQRLSAHARFESIAPLDAATSLPPYVTGDGLFGIPAGDQLVAVRLYGPTGGTITEVELNREPIQDLELIEIQGRQVATIYVLLQPQKVVDLKWNMFVEQWGAGPIEIAITPGVDPQQRVTVSEDPC